MNASIGCGDEVRAPTASDDDVGDDDTALDEDGDGYSAEEDCDDSDATIHPGAEDPPCDGIDHDCDGAIGARIGDHEFDSIQGALDDAVSGDTILVCPGVHHEHLVLESSGDLEQLTLTSLSGDAVDTILDGLGLFRLLEVERVGEFSVTALTFRDGTTEMPEVFESSGGAILAEETTLDVRDCVFSGNLATGKGGAVATKGWDTAALSVSHSTFESNAAEGGGGIGVSTHSDITVEIEGCTFSDNSATYSGGAVSAEGSGAATRWPATTS